MDEHQDESDAVTGIALGLLRDPEAVALAAELYQEFMHEGAPGEHAVALLGRLRLRIAEAEVPEDGERSALEGILTGSLGRSAWEWRDYGFARDSRVLLWLAALALAHAEAERLPEPAAGEVRRAIWTAVQAGLAVEAETAGDYLTLGRLGIGLIASITDATAHRIYAAGITDALESLAFLQLRVGNLAQVRASLSAIDRWRADREYLDVVVEGGHEVGAAYVSRSDVLRQIVELTTLPLEGRAAHLATAIDSLATGLAASRTKGELQEQISTCEAMLLTAFDIRTIDSEGRIGTSARNLHLGIQRAARRFRSSGLDRTDDQRLTSCLLIAALWSVDDDGWSERDRDGMLRFLDDVSTSDGMEPDDPKDQWPEELRQAGLLRQTLIALYADGIAELAFRQAHRSAVVSDLESRVDQAVERAALFEGSNVEECAEELLAVRLRCAIRRREEGGEDLRRRVGDWLIARNAVGQVGIPLPLRPRTHRLVVEYLIQRDELELAWQVALATRRDDADEFRLGYFRSSAAALWGDLRDVLAPEMAKSAEALAVAEYQARRLVPDNAQYQYVPDQVRWIPGASDARSIARDLVNQIRGNRPSPQVETDDDVVGIVRGTDHVLIVSRAGGMAHYSVAKCTPGRWAKLSRVGRSEEREIASWLLSGLKQAGFTSSSESRAFRICVEPELYRYCRGGLLVDRAARMCLDDYGAWALDPVLWGASVSSELPTHHWVGIRSVNQPAALDTAELHVGQATARRLGLHENILEIATDTRPVLEQWATSRIIHLATHGGLEQGNPLFGYWAFGEGSRLYVGDLALVSGTCAPILVLSNCHGADASVASGLGLGTGAVVSGARASVAFRGEMRATAAKFMALLTQRLINGDPVGVAALRVRKQMRGLLDEPQNVLQVFGDPLARAVSET